MQKSLQCITCERELKSRKEGLYIKNFKGNWCDLCISYSIYFTIENTYKWVPQKYADLSFSMKEHFMLSLFDKFEAETKEEKAEVDKYLGMVFKSIDTIGEYVGKKYKLNFDDYIMLLKKKEDSNEFVFSGTKNGELFTKEVSLHDRVMSKKMGNFDEF